MGATRYNNGKLELSLLSFKDLKPLVQVMMYGCQKYTRDNWKLGFERNVLIDSMLRHAIELQNGERIDPENNIHHVGGVMFNAMVLHYQDRKEEEENNQIILLK